MVKRTWKDWIGINTLNLDEESSKIISDIAQNYADNKEDFNFSFFIRKLIKEHKTDGKK